MRDLLTTFVNALPSAQADAVWRRLRARTVERVNSRKGYEETVAQNLAPLTHATYESHVRNHLAPGLGDQRIDRIRVTDVQRWLNALPDQCQCCAVGQCCQATPSPRTIKDLRTVLRSALAAAMREELIEKNVASLVRLPKQRKRKTIPWASEEARRFLESATEDDDPYYAA